MSTTSAGKVVLADDDADIRDLLALNLTRWGYEVHQASDGAQALALVREAEPDVILLDIDMPRTSGLMVTEALRADPTMPATPVLLVSANGTGADVATGFAMGADDYVRKPFHLAEIRARVAAAVLRSQEIRALVELRDAILPEEFATHPAVSVAFTYQPARGAVAGGDFLGVVESPGGRLVVFVGDAMGHGPGSAALAAHTRVLLSTFAKYESDPGRILTLANADLSQGGESDASVFVSAAVVSLNPDLGSVSWASAGHPAPFVLPHDRAIELPPVGPPLAVDPEARYEAGTALIERGETILLMSDGVLEARRGREQFGERELDRALSGWNDSCRQHTTPSKSDGPASLNHAIEEALEVFTQGEIHDDVCLVAVSTMQPWGIGRGDI